MARATYTSRPSRLRPRVKMSSRMSSAHISATIRSKQSQRSCACRMSISATPRSSGCATRSAALGRAGDNAYDLDILLRLWRPHGLEHLDGDVAREGDSDSCRRAGNHACDATRVRWRASFGLARHPRSVTARSRAYGVVTDSTENSAADSEIGSDSRTVQHRQRFDRWD